jgi:hypothetical protein
MPSMSDYLEVQMRAHMFRTASFTKPTALWIALFTATPSDVGGGTEVTKAGGTGYLRVQRNPLDANWSAPDSTGGVTANLAAITFPSPTANWGTIVAVGIFDSDDTGSNNLLFWGPLAASKTVNNGDAAPSFGIGALSVTFD